MRLKKLESLLVVGAVLAGTAYAAEESGPASTLEEVVVTAQKRAQNAQDVGISLSAVSGSDLQTLGAVAATDITRSVPAVVMTQPNGPSSFSLSIRGVTQNDFADHQESPAAIYIDEVYVSQMAGLAFSLFDIDRVEVLRGPQGTLFGRNATGGLANFITRKPTDEQTGYVDVTFGQRNLTRVEGAVNSPIVDGVDARLAFETNHYDPLFKNVAGGAADSENGNDWALRGELLFKLPNTGELLVTGRFAREDVHAGAWEERPIYNAVPGSGIDVFVPANLNPYGTCNGCNASGLTASGPFTTRDNMSGYAKIKTSGVSAKYTQDIGGPTLTVIADYSTLRKDYQEDSDASPLTVFEFFNGSNVKQQSLEARLNGGDKTFNWTAGLYGLRVAGNYYEGYYGPAFFAAQEFMSPAPNPNRGCGFPPDGGWPYGTCPYTTDPGVPGGDGGTPGIRSPYSQLIKSYAAFGQVEYKVTDLIGLTLGGRATHDQKDFQFGWFPFESFSDGTVTRLTPPVIPGVGNALFDYSNSLSNTEWSGKAQIDFHLTQDMLAYASYNRGVKGGGFTAPLFPDTIADLSPLKFKPEKLNSYEVGFKSELLDHTLRINAAAYYYDYRDYQALIYTVALEQLIVNANAKHKGAEFETEWRPNRYWQFGLGGAYVDAVVLNVDSRGTGVKGDFTAPNAPRWSGNALARYNQPIGPGTVSLQLDGNYMTSFWFNLANTPVVQQKGYGIGNARLFYTPKNANWEVGASLENLANKHYGVMGFDNTGINGLAQLYPGNPRWWKAHVLYHF